MLKNFQFSAYKIHLSRTIRQILLNDSAKVNLMPVLQQILLDEKFRFLKSVEVALNQRIQDLATEQPSVYTVYYLTGQTELKIKVLRIFMIVKD